MAKPYTPTSAAEDVEAALKMLEGRWKLVILFHLFGGKVLRFSDLERVIPSITQKMLGQQLRALEADGIVNRKSYPQVPSEGGVQPHALGTITMSDTGQHSQMGRSKA
jgi:DNA-binding HxlR family transcriptional regulator